MNALSELLLFINSCYSCLDPCLFNWNKITSECGLSSIMLVCMVCLCKQIPYFWSMLVCGESLWIPMCCLGFTYTSLECILNILTRKVITIVPLNNKWQFSSVPFHSDTYQLSEDWSALFCQTNDVNDKCHSFLVSKVAQLVDGAMSSHMRCLLNRWSAITKIDVWEKLHWNACCVPLFLIFSHCMSTFCSIKLCIKWTLCPTRITARGNYSHLSHYRNAKLQTIM